MGKGTRDYDRMIDARWDMASTVFSAAVVTLAVIGFIGFFYCRLTGKL